MQGTVRDFDPRTGTGSVLLDDGREVTFDRAAFAAGGMRLLRFGQRVRLNTVGDRVVLVTIHTFGEDRPASTWAGWTVTPPAADDGAARRAGDASPE